LRKNEVLLVLAFTALTIGTRKPSPVDLVPIAVGLALVLFAVPSIGRSRVDPQVIDDDRSASLLLALVLLSILVGFADPRLARTPSGPKTRNLSAILPAVWCLVLCASYVAHRGRFRLRSAVLAAWIAAVALAGGIAIVVATPQPPIDVFYLHARTAEALARGENPYTEAVTVGDTTPEAPPGAQLVGNVYPPLTATSYALGHRIAGDGRATSLAAWLITLIALLAVVLEMPGAARRIGTLLLLLFAVQPGWPYILEYAWTEPLTVAFIGLALFWWHRRPILSAALLGLAFASKQYFVVAAPLLLLPRTTLPVRRAATAVAVAIVTLLPFLILDARALWDATIAFHLHVAPRPDASNIAGLLGSLGLAWKPPLLLTLGPPLALALWLRRDIDGPSDFAIASASVLGLLFMLGGHAFANYWFLVGALVLLGVVASIGTERRIDRIDSKPGDERLASTPTDRFS
jgi:hypothetical protein